MGYFLFQHLVTLEMNSRIGPTVKHVYAVSTYLSIPQQLTSWVNVVVQLLLQKRSMGETFNMWNIFIVGIGT